MKKLKCTACKHLDARNGWCKVRAERRVKSADVCDYGRLVIRNEYARDYARSHYGTHPERQTGSRGPRMHRKGGEE